MNLPLLIDRTDLRGTCVLVRSGLNVPIKDGQVADRFRIDAALSTFQYLHQQGARSLIVAHIGRDPSETLRPVFAELKKTLPIIFIEDLFSEEAAHAIAALKDGESILFENIRRYPEEKANDAEFAKRIASLATLYVNDAFSASHRAHASIVGVPQHLPSVAGIHFGDEVKELSEALRPSSPSLFILGGAKFDTKLPILKMSLETYDRVHVGGALAHDLLRARGVEIGVSLASDSTDGVESIKDHEKLTLPVDVVVKDGADRVAIRTLSEIEPTDRILDIGPASVRELATSIKAATSIVWNGPLGFYEGGFGAATETTAELIASRTKATSLVGGGDTIAAIGALGLAQDFTFLSTGGGAMLDFLADGTLPGIDALCA